MCHCAAARSAQTTCAAVGQWMAVAPLSSRQVRRVVVLLVVVLLLTSWARLSLHTEDTVSASGVLVTDHSSGSTSDHSSSARSAAAGADTAADRVQWRTSSLPYRHDCDWIVFLHLPKTAGTALLHSLLPYSGLQTVTQRAQVTTRLAAAAAATAAVSTTHIAAIHDESPKQWLQRVRTATAANRRHQQLAEAARRRT